MAAAAKPIPQGYHSVTPYLILNSASDAIAFYKKALGADEVMRMEDPGGKVHHAEIKIGDSRIMLADEHPELQALSPKTIGGSPVSIHLYVADVDAAVERAVADVVRSFDGFVAKYMATGFWSISAIRAPMRTTPSARSAPG